MADSLQKGGQEAGLFNSKLPVDNYKALSSLGKIRIICLLYCLNCFV
jgi:hypothetical protein